MSPKQAAEFRQDRAQELHQLAHILPRFQLVRSADPLNDAARMCQSVSKTDPLGWHLLLERLTFDFDDDDLHDQRHSKPPNPEIMELQLTVDLRGPCLVEDQNSDPFKDLSVECVIEGYCRGSKEVYRTGWHLDRNSYETAASDPVHPIYHFHFGGNALKEIGEYGHHLFLDAPRLSHPPLDAVLGIDFVLSNYLPSRWNRLRQEDGAYEEIVREAQRRYWKPYSYAAAQWWTPVPDEVVWDGAEVWPQLVLGRGT